ncbi:MAG: hypothetical protein AAF340_13735 [Pseudomonadota bacterium]
MNKNDQQIIDLVDDTLEKERDLLLNGAFENFEDFIQSKQAAFEKMSALSERASSKEVARIKDRISENQKLYEAATMGIKAGIERISEIRRVIGNLETYGDDGLVKTTTVSAPKVSMKA